MTTADHVSTTSVATVVAELKPRLRGFLHTYAAAISVASGAVLIAVASALQGGAAAASTSIYSATVTLLFGTSALYHRRTWSPRAHAIMKRLDHSMIFLFIAGTYTPFALLSMHGWAPAVVLVSVWAGAALGLVANVAWIDAPGWVTAPAYLLVGWVGVIAAPQLFDAIGVAGAVLLVVGGALYTLGAVTYATRWPNPFPHTFGFHEVFHLLVTVAVTVQLVAVYLVAA